MAKLQSERRGLVVFVLLAVSLTALMVWNIVRTQHAGRQISQAHDVVSQIHSMLGSIAAAEAAVSHYALTGRDAWLEQFADHTAGAEAGMSDLTRLTRQDRDRAEQIAAIHTLLNRYFVLLRHAIQVRQTEGATSAAAFIAAEEGRSTIEDLRARLASIRASETASIQLHTNAEQRSETVVATVFGMTLALMLLLVARLHRFLGRYSRETQEAEARLKGMNATLERQVAERTQALQQANEQLKQQAAELARSNADLERYAYAAAHDLQEPSRTVAIFSQLVQRRYQSKLNDEGAALLGLLHEDAVRMNHLIGDLLSYSRAIHDPPDLSRADADSALMSALARLENSIRKKQMKITHDRLPVVPANQQHLEQVLYHLISNAIKFSSPGSTVSVGVQEEENHWRFSVEDEGIGIAPEYHERIFVIFQRLSRSYKGSGVGLAFCKRVIERHGGSIGVESVPGQGSTFWFTLPRREPQVHGDPTTEDVAPEHAGRSARS